MGPDGVGPQNEKVEVLDGVVLGKPEADFSIDGGD